MLLEINLPFVVSKIVLLTHKNKHIASTWQMVVFHSRSEDHVLLIIILFYYKEVLAIFNMFKNNSFFFFFEKPDYKSGLLLNRIKTTVQWTSNRSKDTMSPGGQFNQTWALLKAFAFFAIVRCYKELWNTLIY